MYVFDSVFILFGVTWWPSTGKELSPRLFRSCFFLCYAVSIVCAPFSFGDWARVWNSIISVPYHCLFNFTSIIKPPRILPQSKEHLEWLYYNNGKHEQLFRGVWDQPYVPMTPLYPSWIAEHHPRTILEADDHCRCHRHKLCLRLQIVHWLYSSILTL